MIDHPGASICCVFLNKLLNARLNCVTCQKLSANMGIERDVILSGSDTQVWHQLDVGRVDVKPFYKRLYLETFKHGWGQNSLVSTQHTPQADSVTLTCETPAWLVSSDVGRKPDKRQRTLDHEPDFPFKSTLWVQVLAIFDAICSKVASKFPQGCKVSRQDTNLAPVPCALPKDERNR